MRQTFFSVLALALAACSAAPTAHAETDAARRVITVTGEGEASAAPDIASLSIGVETQAPSAATALSQNAVKMRAAIDKLKAAGVADKDMQTQNLSINPTYRYAEVPRVQAIVGYSASNMRAVELRSLANSGDGARAAVSTCAICLLSLPLFVVFAATLSHTSSHA